MATTTLARNRPKAETVESLGAALAQLHDERTDAQRRIVAETERRAELLATGTAAEIRDAEEAVRLLRIDIERLAARVAPLESKLAVALGREKLSQLDALRVDADAASQKFINFWRDQYEVLARQIAEGLELEGSAMAAVAAYDRAAGLANADSDVQAAGGAPPHMVEDLPRAYVSGAMRSPATVICLPSVGRAPPIAWPKGYSLDRPHVAGEAAAYGG